MAGKASNNVPVTLWARRVRGQRSARVSCAAFWRWIGWGVWTLPLLSLVVGCHAKHTASDAIGPGVSVVLTTDKRTYAAGEPIALTLALVNAGSEPLRLRFMTAQRYDFTLQDQRGQQVWRWSSERFFAQVLGEETIAPGGALSYSATVRHALPTGWYTAVGVLPAAEGRVSASMGIEIR
jgi:hypothetical protein